MAIAIQQVLYVVFSNEKLERFLHEIDGVIEVEQCILKLPIVSFALLCDTTNNSHCYQLLDSKT